MNPVFNSWNSHKKKKIINFAKGKERKRKKKMQPLPQIAMDDFLKVITIETSRRCSVQK
jgi:hypothetical protein